MKRKIQIIFALLLSLTASICFAQDPQQYKKSSYSIVPETKNKIEPNAILTELKPGQMYDDFVIVKNESEEELTLDIYPTDSMASNDGNLAFKNQNAEQANIGAWTKIDKDQVTLEAGQSEKIHFSVAVPQNVDKKSYVGGIALRKKNLNEENIQKGIIFSTRVLLPVIVKVTDTPQEIPKLVEANIFNSTTPYFWSSIGIFIATMAYFIYAKKREKNAQKQESKN